MPGVLKSTGGTTQGRMTLPDVNDTPVEEPPDLGSRIPVAGGPTEALGFTCKQKLPFVAFGVFCSEIWLC